MGMFADKKLPAAAPYDGSDDEVAAKLKESAQETARLAGVLQKRGWTVSVNIYPYTSDNGPMASVSAYRTQKLLGE